MVTGQFTGQLFARQEWNSKIQNNPNIDQSIFIDNFRSQLNNGQAINSLNLNRVYFITTDNSASASELVMNGLAPYITVNSVGTATTGKVNGSIPLYDSDDLTRNGDNLNPNHTFALLPLTFETVNASGNNFPAGINPTVILPENFGNLGVLGTRSDPLLDRAMILITTGSRSSVATPQYQMEEVYNSQISRPMRNNMFTSLKK
jgi:C-terminal processing protease CtpA/Prc